MTKIAISLVVGLMTTLSGAAVHGQSSITEQQTTVRETTIGSVEEEAARWQLTSDEYSKYLEALEGPRGRLSDPNITPIEVLGIEAQTTAEREHYARLWVEMIRRDTAKALAFTRSVHSAWLDIAPDRKLIDPLLLQRLKLRKGGSSLSLNDRPSRLVIFTSLDCERCDADMQRLLGGINEGFYLGLDIFIVGAAGDHEQIQDWAGKQNIPVDLVQAGTITLNIDGGELQTLKAAYAISKDEFPIVMRREGEGYEVVDSY